MDGNRQHRLSRSSTRGRLVSMASLSSRSQYLSPSLDSTCALEYMLNGNWIDGNLKLYAWQEEHRCSDLLAFSPFNFVYWMDAIIIVIKHHTFFWRFYSWYGELIEQLFPCIPLHPAPPRVHLSHCWVKTSGGSHAFLDWTMLAMRAVFQHNKTPYFI